MLFLIVALLLVLLTSFIVFGAGEEVPGGPDYVVPSSISLHG